MLGLSERCKGIYPPPVLLDNAAACRSGDFVANMSVGDTLLSTQLVQFSPDASYLSSATLSQQPQLTQLVAEQQLLCTGEVEDVRGESGSFPADIQQLESDGQRIYHPRGNAGAVHD